MKVTVHKHCFGHRVEIKGEDIELNCDGYFFETVLNEVGQLVEFDEDECEQCFDRNYTNVYKIDKEKWEAIKILFL